MRNFFLNCLLGSAIFISFSSCTIHRLEVQTQYLTPEYLASDHIGTPDPHLYAPLVGQRLLVQWSLSSKECEDHPLFLYLKVRFRNHQEKEIRMPIDSKRGHYIYLVNRDLYCQTNGILTYFAQIQKGSCVLATWRHPLWAELIELNVPTVDVQPDEESVKKQTLSSLIKGSLT